MNIIFKMLKYLKNYSNLIKSVIIIALVIALATVSVLAINYKSSYQEEVKSGLTKQTELDSIKKQNEELQTKISEQESELTDKSKQLKNRDEKIQKLEKETKDLKAKVAVKKSNASKVNGNYTQATQVWNHLRSLGLNKYVCAGIVGNIMCEVGGNTLYFNKYSQTFSGKYYGICQWSGSRKQRLLNNFGTSLNSQLNFLSVELFEVIPKGNSFYNMQDEKQAALYFAKYYERCGSSSYSVRQRNATKALNYFA